MKRIFRPTLYVLLLLIAGACARHKIIPDEKLAQIFRDAFLTNAYINNKSVNIDSLNVYEPIFASYGYTTNDVQYTIGNFSKRKSARLGDVVERAIQMLEEEGTYYNREVAALDTIDNAARREFTRPVLQDSLIRIKSLRDTTKLKFRIDVKPGEYNVRLKYLVDSLDQNDQGIRGSIWLEGKDSTRTSVYYLSMRRNREEPFSRRLTTDSTHRALRVDLISFNGKPRQPSLTVRDFVIEYTPVTREAVDSLYQKQLDIRIFADEFFRINPKDSL